MNPPANSSRCALIPKIKNGSTVDCVWKKARSSNVTEVAAVELFTLRGYVSTLWNKGVKFPKNKVRTHASVKMIVPKRFKLPCKVLLRASARTKFGPHCNTYSKEIIIY